MKFNEWQPRFLAECEEPEAELALENGQLHEVGGAGRNTGEALIIAAPDGTAMKSLTRVGGNMSEFHATFTPVVGMFVVVVQQERGDSTRSIWTIDRIEENTAMLRQINHYKSGVWASPTAEVPDGLFAAIDAADEKAECYHCHHAHWAR